MVEERPSVRFQSLRVRPQCGHQETVKCEQFQCSDVVAGKSMTSFAFSLEGDSNWNLHIGFCVVFPTLTSFSWCHSCTHDNTPLAVPDQFCTRSETFQISGFSLSAKLKETSGSDDNVCLQHSPWIKTILGKKHCHALVTWVTIPIKAF